MAILSNSNKIFWLGVSTLVGSTIGVGIYGIPFVFQKAGFLVGFLFLISLGGLMLLANLIYGEVVLRTHERHQFIGYTNKYLGHTMERVNLITFMLSGYGALIGIIIISSGFLVNILAGWLHFSPSDWSTIFVVFAAILIFKGLRTVSRIDFFMMLTFIFVIMAIGLWGAKHINMTNFSLVTKDFWFLPFGVLMFALNGMSGVPLAREVMWGQEDKLKKALMLGTLLPAIIYLLFATVVVGVSGDLTSPDAMSGLATPLGLGVVLVGSFLGLVTSLTIFLNIGVALKESFQEDFHFKPRWAWLLAIVPPYVLYLSGIRNFIDIISLVGGLAVSLELIILIFVYASARKHGDRMPEYSIQLPMPVIYIMMLIFAAGAVYTLITK